MSRVKPYQLIPFRFTRFNDDYLLVNEVGEHEFISSTIFGDFTSHQLSTQSSEFLNLKSKYFVTDSDVGPVIDMLAIKYRTKKSFLYNFTSLHMVVPTLRCNSNCIYCQVSKKDPDAAGFDMDTRTAKNTVDAIFTSPSSHIKIEFQGGEPLLNFKMVKYIVKYAIKLNKKHKKDLAFVICTNLTLITPRVAKFLKKYNIPISTSVDGSCDVHNRNRPLQNSELSHPIVTRNMQMVNKIMGPGNVSALMTTTRHNINLLRSVIDEYVHLGFDHVFIRNLNPYGGAKQEVKAIGYPIEDFVTNYKDALNYIIELNLKGIYIVEAFAALLLERILTPFATGFVDLQSPAGVGIEGAVYDYNGNVYVSDEGRMLAAMGDQYFLLGNVNENSHAEIFGSEKLRSIIRNSCLESTPICASCAFQSFCGADPIRNYAEHGKIECHANLSKTCKKCKPILMHLFELIKRDDKTINKVFWSWINRKPFDGEVIN
ncbi:MAG: His-Xaa-Ser system radical SAM maturase HxsB [Planctomycetes bacterium GWF2_42_9]|nr:MAG: His-Xaa-Ser system radical SAM maturase HxsB [Planctomycetes bacterium GWF2_42_9]